MISHNDGYRPMMDFVPKTNVTSLNTKGLDNKRIPEDLHVEIVLLDRSNDHMRPVLYQFRNDLIQLEKNSLEPIEKNAFIWLGEVDTINKKRKEVYLTNYRTVTYKYLVAASGLTQTSLADIHDEELSAGVIALWEALRVRSNSFPPLTTSYKYEPKSDPLPPVTQEHNKSAEHIQKVAIPKAFRKVQESSSPFLSTTEKRVYELQL